MTDKEILAAMKEMLIEERKYTDAKIDSAQKGTIQQVKVLLENGVERQMKIIAEGHARILERLPDAEKQEELESHVTTLEHIAKDHTQKIRQLQQAR